MAEIEKESTDKTGLRSDVVTLYQGGQYHLYTYKKYTDVRLVFAPEFDIAFFGGDPDNFEYPRYDLDVCFFRAYEDGKPARPPHHLKWSKNGTKEGDLVFVAGHPGRTDRLNTVAQPRVPARRRASRSCSTSCTTKEAFLLDYGRRGPRRSARRRKSSSPSRTAARPGSAGCRGFTTRRSWPARREAEKELRERVAADPEEARGLRRAPGTGSPRPQKVVGRDRQAVYLPGTRARPFDSRALHDRPRPRPARRGEAQAERRPAQGVPRLGLASLELDLFSDGPDLPRIRGGQARPLARPTGRRSCPTTRCSIRSSTAARPSEAAAELVAGTQARRRRGAARSSPRGARRRSRRRDDPMIKLALLSMPSPRRLRKEHEDQVEGVEAANYALIAKALFEDEGDSVYPDATFTLRLAFGLVKGYEVDGKPIPPFTDDRRRLRACQGPRQQGSLRAPARAGTRRRQAGRLNLKTPLNFVSTADIIGGNSGSPVVNRDNEVVGLIFDGNIQSLVLDFGYDDKTARAVSVDSRGIVEALRSIYHADRLVKELTGH